MNKILEVTNLKKTYGKVDAVKGIDFYVEKGKLFAFLGPNGAGKSTTIDLLCTLLKSNDGIVKINGRTLGQENHQIRQEIGVVFQEGVVDPLLTVRENLYIRGSFYNFTKRQLGEAVKSAAHSCGVTDFIDRPYGKLSGGQKRRADMARALIHTPKILFLDEPTTGLDPQTRKNIWSTIQRLQREKGITVFLTTHYMEEAADAGYVLIIDDGLIAAKGTPSEIKARYSSDLLKMGSKAVSKMQTILENNSLEYTLMRDVFTLKIKSTIEAVPILEKCREYITSVKVLGGTMDDAFIGITGKEIRE